jgi:hypothetical protein
MRVVDGVLATNLGLHSAKTQACRPIAFARFAKGYRGDEMGTSKEKCSKLYSLKGSWPQGRTYRDGISKDATP